MLTYCLKCKKDTKNIDSKKLKTKNGRSMVLNVLYVIKTRTSKKQKDS